MAFLSLWGEGYMHHHLLQFEVCAFREVSPRDQQSCLMKNTFTHAFTPALFFLLSRRLCGALWFVDAAPGCSHS